MVSSKSLKQIVAAAAVMRYRRLKKMARRQRRRQMAMQQQQQQQQQRSSSQEQGLVSASTGGDGSVSGRGVGTSSSMVSPLFILGREYTEGGCEGVLTGVSGEGTEVGVGTEVGAMEEYPSDLLAMRAERRVMRVSQGQRQGSLGLGPASAPGQGLGGGQGMSSPLGSFDDQGNTIISGQYNTKQTTKPPRQ